MSATALVILPFETPQQAEQFARLAIAQTETSALPIVLHGTAYEYHSADVDESGQVIEIWPGSNFDVFVGDKGEKHHILQRTTKEN